MSASMKDAGIGDQPRYMRRGAEYVGSAHGDGVSSSAVDERHGLHVAPHIVYVKLGAADVDPAETISGDAQGLLELNISHGDRRSIANAYAEVRAREGDRGIVAHDRSSLANEADESFIASMRKDDVGVSHVDQLRSVLNGAWRCLGARVRSRSRR